MSPPEKIAMPAIKYRVTLTDDEVGLLEALLRRGKSAARKQTRARILLKAAAGCLCLPEDVGAIRHASIDEPQEELLGHSVQNRL